MVGYRQSIEQTFERIMNEGKGELPARRHRPSRRALERRHATGCGETPYELEDGDKVVFRSSYSGANERRSALPGRKATLRMQGARIYDEVHVSGVLNKVKPTTAVAVWVLGMNRSGESDPRGCAALQYG